MDKMLTPEALAEQLDLHPYTVRRMLREGQFQGAFQIGRRWRVPESALRAWIGARQAAASGRERREEKAG